MAVSRLPQVLVLLLISFFFSAKSFSQDSDLTIESTFHDGEIIFEIYNEGNSDIILRKVPWFDSDMAYMTLCEVPFLVKCKPRMDFLDTRYPYEVPIKSNSSVKGGVDILHLFGDFYEKASGEYVLLWYFESNGISYHGVVEVNE